MGAVAGPLVGGVLGEVLNLRASFAAGAVAFAVAIGAQFVLYLKQRANSDPDPIIAATFPTKDEAR
jgi:hypothetical protein